MDDVIFLLVVALLGMLLGAGRSPAPPRPTKNGSFHWRWLLTALLGAAATSAVVLTLRSSSGLSDRATRAPEAQFGLFLDFPATLALSARPTASTEPDSAFQLNLTRDEDGQWSGELQFIGLGSPDLWLFGESDAPGSIFFTAPARTNVPRVSQSMLGAAGRCAQWISEPDEAGSLSAPAQSFSPYSVHQLDSITVVECPLPALEAPLSEILYQITLEDIPIDESRLSHSRRQVNLDVTRSAASVDGIHEFEDADLRLISLLPVDLVIMPAHPWGLASSFPPPSSGSPGSREWAAPDRGNSTAYELTFENANDRRSAEARREVLLLITGGLLSALAGVLAAPLVVRRP